MPVSMHAWWLAVVLASPPRASDIVVKRCRESSPGPVSPAVSPGYTCIHRSEDAANYTRGDEGLDLLYAHRPIARRLLAEAEARDTPMGRLRVISAEGLIAFKLQGFVNDPSRTRDLEDIRSLLRAGRATLDMGEVARYFRLFEREALHDELIAEAQGPVR